MGELGDINATAGDTAADICRWIAWFFNTPAPTPLTKLVPQVDADGVWINAEGVIETWRQVFEGGAKVSAKKIGAALKTLAETRTETRDTPIGKRRFWNVSMRKVHSWADRHGLGDLERLKKLVENPGRYQPPETPVRLHLKLTTHVREMLTTRLQSKLTTHLHGKLTRRLQRS